MTLLNGFITVFLWPGDFVRRRAGMTVEEDGGILRSFVNMCVWGTILTWAALKYYT